MSGFFEDFDPADLLGTGVVEEQHEESSALLQVANRISAQYGEVIASWSASALSSSKPASTGGLDATVANVLRLAASSGNQAQVALLEELRETLGMIEGTVPNSRIGDHARVRLRDWLPRFAETLEGEDAARLRTLVQWDPNRVPFLEELRTVRGVGPRRLTRLYSAGLGQLDVVANASPNEVSEVTGIPLGVAEEVVRRARTFAIEERNRCVEEIRERAARLQMLLTRVHGDPNDDLVKAAHDALQHVEGAFRTLLSPEPEEGS